MKAQTIQHTNKWIQTHENTHESTYSTHTHTHSKAFGTMTAAAALVHDGSVKVIRRFFVPLV